MNGDEVRRLVFPRGRGYDSAAVDELLDRLAAELDAGRPVAPLIKAAAFPREDWAWALKWSNPLAGTRGGYECGDVDGVLSQLLRQDDPAWSADPWRDLPAWRYSVMSQDAGAAGGAANRRAVLPRSVRVQAADDYARACADAWRDFSLPRGTQLSLVKTGPGRSELRADGQPALVSARTGYAEFISTAVIYLLNQAPDTPPARTFGRDGRTCTLSRVKAARWPAVAADLSAESPGSPAHLLRTDPVPRTGKEAAGHDPAVRTARRLYTLADQAGQPALYTSGQHANRYPGGEVEFPGQRWLRFPVRGTGRPDAIMTAVDQAGRHVARYRIATPHPLTKWREIEITVHPEQRLTDELILMLAFTAPWISSFFRSQSEGGG